MTWKGRIIGTIIGFLFGGIGAVIGFAIGYYFHDKQKNEEYKQILETKSAFSGTGSRAHDHAVLIQSTFRLMGYVARGAGRINESHIKQSEHIMNVMALNDRMRAFAIECFNQGKSDNFNLSDEALRLRALVGSNVTMLSFLLEIQVGVAIADEELSQGEHERLLNIAMAMNIPLDKMEKLIRVRLAEQQFSRFAREFYESRQSHQDNYSYSSNSQYQSEPESENNYSNNSSNSYDNGSKESHQSYRNSYKSELETAYEILGITSDTPWDEIRKAHKKLMLKYHPDRLASQGLPPEMIKLYTQKAQDIQAAFNLIKKYQGK